MASNDVPNRYLLPRVVSPERSPDFEHLETFDSSRPVHLFPSPAEVRANPILRDVIGSCTTKFDSLNIVVKYGSNITGSEAYCLRALRQLLPDEVPVPDVYGWCEDGGEGFIYMELIRGVTLERQWGSLSDQAKKEVCKQLRTAVDGLRKLQQDPSEQFLGKSLGRIDRKPLLDVAFTDDTKPPAGPFNTVKDLHDWLSALVRRGMEIHFDGDPSKVPDPIRQYLPDDSKVVFTHADLHPSNIMVSDDATGRLLAIIDWHQSGWYPEYWESCKAQFTTDFKGEWATEYIPQFVEDTEVYDTWAFYPQSLGY